MALSRIKTWIAEILTYADLNAEFNNILTNGAGSLSSPRTANFDLDGYTIILDTAATSYFQASTQNLLDLYGASTLLFKFDMTVSTPVNALSFVASATGVPVQITARGSDTNLGIAIIPKAAGKVGLLGPSNWADGAGTADAITCTISPGPTAWIDGYRFNVRATAANTTTTPTVNPTGTSGSAWGAKTIVKGANAALAVGDIIGNSHELQLIYASDIDRVVLLNPANSAALNLNALTTDATGGVAADFIPFVDASESNASNKVLVTDFMTNALGAVTTDTSGGATGDLIPFLDASASNEANKVTVDVLLTNALQLLTTDNGGVAVGDFIPFVDVSESNVANKCTLAALASSVIAASTDTVPGGAGQALYEVGSRKVSDASIHRHLLSEIGVGKKSIYIPSTSMVPSTTGGPSVGTVETTTHKIMLKSLDFDAASTETAQYAMRMPKGWDGGTVSAVFVWSHAAAATFVVVWGLQATALGNDDAADQAFGGTQTATDTGGTTNDIYHSPETAAVTIAGPAAAQDWVVFQFIRDGANGSDTLNADARLLGVELYYTTNANTDD